MRVPAYNLDKHFHALVEINYSIVESPANDKIEVRVNNYTKNISIAVLDGSWFGTQKFNLTAITEDGDVLNTGNSGADMTFNIIVVRLIITFLLLVIIGVIAGTAVFLPRALKYDALTAENEQLKKQLEQAKLELKLERQNKFATNQQKQEEADADTLLKLLGALDESDDVQQVSANFEISDDVMTRLTAG